MARNRTEAEILLEQKALIKLQELGAEIIDHRSFTSLSDKVKDQLAKTMKMDILDITGAAGSERDIKSMLEQIDPSITFFRLQKFDRATGQNKVIHTTIYHDTIDDQIKNAIGFSLEDLYKRQDLLNPNKN